MKRMSVDQNNAGDLTLRFTCHSNPDKAIVLLQSEVKDLTPHESFHFLYKKIENSLGLCEETVQEIELDGDEDDEDVSLFEEEVTVRDYMEGDTP